MTASVAPVDATASKLEKWWDGYWFEEMPMERLRIFSRIVHIMVFLGVTALDDFVPPHGWTARSFWQPIGIARLLHIPAPTTTTMPILQWGLIVSSVVAILAAGSGTRPGLSFATQRIFSRCVNAVVAAGYALWLIWAFSFSKVDHDRLTILVALVALVVVPAVGTGRDRSAGWALRTVQVVFILAYPLSAISKFRKSGFGWASKATFARAIIRRGSPFGKWFLNHGQMLKVGQWAFILFELLAVAGLWRNRWVRAGVLIGVFFLHLFTWAAIGIHFLPHSICMTAFLPLERLVLRRSPVTTAAA